jgi:AcrR family transcriptional regulator
MATGQDTATAAARGGKLTAKGRATRGRIVEVAAQLMLERGVARTTVEDIQSEARVSASQLYHYFGDKKALVHAVIEHITDQVLCTQRQAAGPLDSFAALGQWRDFVVDFQRQRGGAGGCPLGTLVSDLAETDPQARAELAASLGQWEGLLRDGLTAMRDRGELSPAADPDQLALALLAAVQGGLLLSQARRDTRALEVALDTALAHLRTLARA